MNALDAALPPASLSLSSPPPRRARAPYALLVAAATVTFVADVLTKLWAVTVLEIDGRVAIEVVRGNLDLVMARNPGAAFSFMRDAPEWVRRPLFISVSVLAVVFITGAYRRLDADRTAARWGFALVLGGALGNLVDRIRDASVVDFIQVHAHLGAGGRELRWPTFNVADVAICAGVLLLAVDLFRGRRGAAHPAHAHAQPPSLS